jgi:hypothetical protein
MNQSDFEKIRGPGAQVLWFGEVELRRGFRLPGKVLRDAGEKAYLVILEPGSRLRRVRTRMPPEWFHPALPGEIYDNLAWQ